MDNRKLRIGELITYLGVGGLLFFLAVKCGNAGAVAELLLAALAFCGWFLVAIAFAIKGRTGAWSMLGVCVGGFLLAVLLMLFLSCVLYVNLTSRA